MSCELKKVIENPTEMNLNLKRLNLLTPSSRTYHPHDSNEDDECHGKVGYMSLSVDVRMSTLVDLQHYQARYDVHEGCV